LDIAKSPFPAAMLDFIKWGHANRRGQSTTKLALDAAQATLDKLDAEMHELLIAADFTNPRLGEIGAQLPAVKAAVASAKAAHEAAEAAKPKKAKAAKSKPVEEMTEDEATAELARLEAEANEVVQH
jgi:hypothetical protein